MPRGISLHVGINEVSDDAFPGLAPLVGCEGDAEAMRDIAELKGFAPATLLQGKEAKFKTVVKNIKEAAAALHEGDIFLFTFAGHGCPTFDEDLNLVEEPDELDENIVLFDLILLDDYMRRVLWPQFRKGVRIVGVADSCHSGTSLMGVAEEESIVLTEHREITVSSGAGGVATVTDVHTVGLFSLDGESDAAHVPEFTPEGKPRWDGGPAVNARGPFRDRQLSVAEGFAHLAANKPSYDDLNIPSAEDAPDVKASVLVLGACQDKDKTRDGSPHGEFTAALLKVWDGGQFPGNYVQFRKDIEDGLPLRDPKQIPVLKQSVPPGFSAESPFTI